MKALSTLCVWDTGTDTVLTCVPLLDSKGEQASWFYNFFPLPNYGDLVTSCMDLVFFKSNFIPCVKKNSGHSDECKGWNIKRTVVISWVKRDELPLYSQTQYKILNPLGGLWNCPSLHPQSQKQVENFWLRRETSKGRQNNEKIHFYFDKAHAREFVINSLNLT